MPFSSSKNSSLSDTLEHKVAGITVDALGRKWDPSKHPRDSKGRFIETGGIARLWGGGLGKVVRSLAGGKVEVETADGKSRVVAGNRLTMVRRPNGEKPTANRLKVAEEDERREKAPNRGDGQLARDPGELDGIPDVDPEDEDEDNEDDSDDDQYDGEDTYQPSREEAREGDVIALRGKNQRGQERWLLATVDSVENGEVASVRLADGTRKRRDSYPGDRDADTVIPREDLTDPASLIEDASKENGAARTFDTVDVTDLLDGHAKPERKAPPSRRDPEAIEAAPKADKGKAKTALVHAADIQITAARNGEVTHNGQVVGRIKKDPATKKFVVTDTDGTVIHKGIGSWDKGAERLAKHLNDRNRKQREQQAANPEAPAAPGEKPATAKQSGVPVTDAAGNPIGTIKPSDKGGFTGSTRRGGRTIAFRGKTEDEVRAKLEREHAAQQATPATPAAPAVIEAGDRVNTPAGPGTARVVVGGAKPMATVDLDDGTSKRYRLSALTRADNAQQATPEAPAADVDPLGREENRDLVETPDAPSAEDADAKVRDMDDAALAKMTALTSPKYAALRDAAVREQERRDAEKIAAAEQSTPAVAPPADEQGDLPDANPAQQYADKIAAAPTPAAVQAAKNNARRYGIDLNTEVTDGNGERRKLRDVAKDRLAALAEQQRPQETPAATPRAGEQGDLLATSKPAPAKPSFRDQVNEDRDEYAAEAQKYADRLARAKTAATAEATQRAIMREGNGTQEVTDSNGQRRPLHEVARERVAELRAAKAKKQTQPAERPAEAPDTTYPENTAPEGADRGAVPEPDPSLLGDVPAERGGEDGARRPGAVLSEPRSGRGGGDRERDGGEPRSVEPTDRQPADTGEAPSDSSSESARGGAGRPGVPAEGAGDGGTDDADLAATVDAAQRGVDGQAFRPTTQADLAGGSKKDAKDRAQENLDALRTLRKIQEEGRTTATADEQAVMARWGGLGAIKQLFTGKDKDWKRLREEFRELVPDDAEWEALKDNSANAHYTDYAIVDAMWSALENLGFAGGNVLEPGSGLGNFMFRAPGGAKVHGVEVEPTTAAIAQLLSPDHVVRHEDFGRTRANKGAFDAAIGNVPFGNYKVYDGEFNPKLSKRIHDHFIEKSLASVKPGGVMAMVTSAGTLDKSSREAREAIYKNADLIGAVRLPNGAHKDAAGTDVATDVLLFRVRKPGEKPGDAAWLGSSIRTHDNGMPVTGSRKDSDGNPLPQVMNDYFLDHPENVLGEVVDGGFNHIEVRGEFDPDALATALDNIVQDALHRGVDFNAEPAEGDLFREPAKRLVASVIEPERPADGIGENILRQPSQETIARRGNRLQGSITHVGTWKRKRPKTVAASGSVAGKVKVAEEHQFSIVDATGGEVPYVPSQGERDELARLLRMRDLREDLIALEKSEEDDTPQMDALRQELSDEYDAYTAIYGPIGRMKVAWRKMTPAQSAKYQEALDRGEDPDPDIRQAGDGFERVSKTSPGMGGMRNDPSFWALLSLEDEYEEGSPDDPHDWGQATRGAILSERQMRPYVAPETADNADDALTLVEEKYGRIDLAEVARVLGLEGGERAAQDVLGDRILKDHKTGEWVRYRSYIGKINLRKTLRELQEKVQEDPSLQRNIDMITAALPADKDLKDISVRLGANWMPTETFLNFMRETIGGAAGNRVTLGLEKDDDGRNVWSIKNQEVGDASIIGGSWTPDNRTPEQRNPNSAQFTPLVAKYGTSRKTFQQLVEHALNNSIPAVYDKQTDAYGNETKVLNPAETEAAKDMLVRVQSQFALWLRSDPERAANLTRIYNDRYRSRVPANYINSPDRALPGMSDAVKLDPHQIDGVTRGVEEDAMGAAWEVGVGKTFLAAALYAERIRLGKSKKVYHTTPNHLVEQTAREFKHLYPDMKILVVDGESMKSGPKGDTERVRRRTLSQMRDGDWDVVIVSESADARILPDLEDLIADRQAQLDKLRVKREKAEDKGDTNAFNQITQQIKDLEAQIEQDRDQLSSPDRMDFTALGFDYIGVDESHRYKNDLVIGGPPNFNSASNASKRARNLRAKIDGVRKFNRSQGRDHGVLLLSGTPVTNNTREFYVNLRMLRPDLLEEAGVLDFDDFYSMFLEASEDIEGTVYGGTQLKARDGFKLENGGELVRMWQQAWDVVKAADVGIERPELKGGAMEQVVIGMTEHQLDYYRHLHERYKNRPKKWKLAKGDDNALAIGNDGLMAAIDMRLLSDSELAAVGLRREDLTDDDGKIGPLAEKVIAEYNRTKDNVYQVKKGKDRNGNPHPEHPNRGALQLIFSDVGVPGGNSASGFNMYEAIKNRLIADGMNPDEVAFIHDAADRATMKKLTDKARAGEIKVLIGSSAKMATGLNVQDRLTQIWHVDTQKTPDVIEQRNGRGIRRGNQNAEVGIGYVTTEGTSEAWAWSVAANKDNFLREFDEADMDSTIIGAPEDNAAQPLTQLKATASQDPHMIEQFRAKKDTQGLERAYAIHQGQIESARGTVTRASNKIEGLDATLASFDKALEGFEPITSGENSNFLLRTTDGGSHSKLDSAAQAFEKAVRAAMTRDQWADTAPWASWGTLGGQELTIRRLRTFDGTMIEVGIKDPNAPFYDRDKMLPGSIKRFDPTAKFDSNMAVRLRNLVNGLPNMKKAVADERLDQENALRQARESLENTEFDRMAELEAARARVDALDKLARFDLEGGSGTGGEDATSAVAGGREAREAKREALEKAYLDAKDNFKNLHDEWIEANGGVKTAAKLGATKRSRRQSQAEAADRMNERIEASGVPLNKVPRKVRTLSDEEAAKRVAGKPRKPSGQKKPGTRKPSSSGSGSRSAAAAEDDDADADESTLTIAPEDLPTIEDEDTDEPIGTPEQAEAEQGMDAAEAADEPIDVLSGDGEGDEPTVSLTPEEVAADRADLADEPTEVDDAPTPGEDSALTEEPDEEPADALGTIANSDEWDEDDTEGEIPSPGQPFVIGNTVYTMGESTFDGFEATDADGNTVELTLDDLDGWEPYEAPEEPTDDALDGLDLPEPEKAPSKPRTPRGERKPGTGRADQERQGALDIQDTEGDGSQPSINDAIAEQEAEEAPAQPERQQPMTHDQARAWVEEHQGEWFTLDDASLDGEWEPVRAYRSGMVTMRERETGEERHALVESLTPARADDDSTVTVAPEDLPSVDDAGDDEPPADTPEAAAEDEEPEPRSLMKDRAAALRRFQDDGDTTPELAGEAGRRIGSWANEGDENALRYVNGEPMDPDSLRALSDRFDAEAANEARDAERRRRLELAGIFAQRADSLAEQRGDASTESADEPESNLADEWRQRLNEGDDSWSDFDGVDSLIPLSEFGVRTYDDRAFQPRAPLGRWIANNVHGADNPLPSPQSVNVNDVTIAAQPTVRAEVLKHYLDSNEPWDPDYADAGMFGNVAPLLLRMPDGDLMVLDGTHRWLTAKLRGEDTMQAQIVDVPEGALRNDAPAAAPAGERDAAPTGGLPDATMGESTLADGSPAPSLDEPERDPANYDENGMGKVSRVPGALHVDTLLGDAEVARQEDGTWAVTYPDADRPDDVFPTQREGLAAIRSWLAEHHGLTSEATADEPTDRDAADDATDGADIAGDRALPPAPVDEDHKDSLDYEPKTPTQMPDEKFPLTPQAQKIADAAVADMQNVVAEAGAGAGKTTILAGIARRERAVRPETRIGYGAYNKSVQVEAETRMPTNVEPRTGHSLAWQWADKAITGKRDDKNALRRADEVAAHLGVKDLTTTGGEPVEADRIAQAVLRTVDTYSNSAEDKIGLEHLPEVVSDLSDADKKKVLAWANKAWEDLKDPNGKLHIDFDHIRKMWALSRPDFSKPGSGFETPIDLLFVDEAQDTPPVLAKVFEDQTIRKVIVGDTNQAIYGFTGAIDYLKKAAADVRLPLTKSFRFGPQVADWGNRFLQVLGAKERIVGGGSEGRIVRDMQGADAILVRSNGGMIGEIVKEQDAGRIVGVPKGTKADLRALVDSARYLKGEGSAPDRMHEDLSPFRTWAEFEKAATDEKNPDPKLAMLHRMVEDRGVDELDRIVSAVRELSDSPFKDVSFRKTDAGMMAKGKTFEEPALSALKADRGWRFMEIPEGVPGHGPYKFGKNKGKPRKAWFAQGTDAEQEAALDRLRQAGNQGPDPDVIVSTAHKAKGLEWDRVRIGDDFRGPKENPLTGEMIMPSDEELKLAYVAVTRAGKELDLGSLGWVEGYSTPNGEGDRPDPNKADEKVTLTPEEVAAQREDLTDGDSQAPVDVDAEASDPEPVEQDAPAEPVSDAAAEALNAERLGLLDLAAMTALIPSDLPWEGTGDSLSAEYDGFRVEVVGGSIGANKKVRYTLFDRDGNPVPWAGKDYYEIIPNPAKNRAEALDRLKEAMTSTLDYELARANMQDFYAANDKAAAAGLPPMVDAGMVRKGSLVEGPRLANGETIRLRVDSVSSSNRGTSPRWGMSANYVRGVDENGNRATILAPYGYVHVLEDNPEGDTRWGERIDGVDPKPYWEMTADEKLWDDYERDHRDQSSEAEERRLNGDQAQFDADREAAERALDAEPTDQPTGYEDADEPRDSSNDTEDERERKREERRRRQRRRNSGRGQGVNVPEDLPDGDAPDLPLDSPTPLVGVGDDDPAGAARDPRVSDDANDTMRREARAAEQVEQNVPAADLSDEDLDGVLEHLRTRINQAMQSQQTVQAREWFDRMKPYAAEKDRRAEAARDERTSGRPEPTGPRPEASDAQLSILGRIAQSFARGWVTPEEGAQRIGFNMPSLRKVIEKGWVEEVDRGAADGDLDRYGLFLTDTGREQLARGLDHGMFGDDERYGTREDVQTFLDAPASETVTVAPEALPTVDADEAPEVAEAPSVGEKIDPDALNVGDVIRGTLASTGEQGELQVESVEQQGGMLVVTGRRMTGMTAGPRDYVRVPTGHRTTRVGGRADDGTREAAWGRTLDALPDADTDEGPIMLTGDELRVGDVFEGKASGRHGRWEVVGTYPTNNPLFTAYKVVPAGRTDDEPIRANLAKNRPVKVLSRAPEQVDADDQAILDAQTDEDRAAIDSLFTPGPTYTPGLGDGAGVPDTRREPLVNGVLRNDGMDFAPDAATGDYTPEQIQHLVDTGASVFADVDGQFILGHFDKVDGDSYGFVPRGGTEDDRIMVDRDVLGTIRAITSAELPGNETDPATLRPGTLVQARDVDSRRRVVGVLTGVTDDGRALVRGTDGREYRTKQGDTVRPIMGAYARGKEPTEAVFAPQDGVWTPAGDGVWAAGVPGEYAAGIRDNGDGTFSWQVQGAPRANLGNDEGQADSLAAAKEAVRDTLAAFALDRDAGEVSMLPGDDTSERDTLSDELADMVRSILGDDNETTAGSDDLADDPAEEAAPDVDGQPAGWVPTGELEPGDIAQVDGDNGNGSATTRTGHVLGTPESVEVHTPGLKVPEKGWRVTIGEDRSGNGERETLLTPGSGMAARAERDEEEVGDANTPRSASESEVLAGATGDTVPTDSNGVGVFPGSVVTGPGGKEGVVAEATDRDVAVRWSGDDEDSRVRPGVLTVVDGKQNRPEGWTGAGQAVRPGMIVQTADGQHGPVESVQGDTVTVGTIDGDVEASAGDLKVIGRLAEGETAQGWKERTFDAPVSEEGPDVRPTDPVKPEALPDGTPASMVNLKPEHKAALLDLGLDTDATSLFDVQQAAARIRHGMPVSKEQATALAEYLRDLIASKGVPAGKARTLKRVLNRVDAAAGRTAAPAPVETAAPTRVTPADFARGDVIALPNPATGAVQWGRIVTFEPKQNGMAVEVLLEDANGDRYREVLAADAEVYRLPDLPDDPDAVEFPAPPADEDRAFTEPRITERAHESAQAVVDAATEGVEAETLDELAEQVIEQLDDPASDAAAQRRAKDRMDTALEQSGVDEEVADEAHDAAEAAADEVAEQVRDTVRNTVEDAQPLPGESDAEAAARVAERLRQAADEVDYDEVVDNAFQRDADTTAPSPAQQAAARRDMVDALRADLFDFAEQLAALGETETAQTLSDAAARLAGRPDEAQVRKAVEAAAMGQGPGAVRSLWARIRGMFARARQAFLDRVKAIMGSGRKAKRSFKAAIAAARSEWNGAPEVDGIVEDAAKHLARGGDRSDLARTGVTEPAGFADRIAYWRDQLPEDGSFGRRKGRGAIFRALTLDALRSGRQVRGEATDGTVLDRAADGGPGQTARQHLAAVNGLGAAVDDEVHARVRAAMPDLGDDPAATVREARRYADSLGSEQRGDMGDAELGKLRKKARKHADDLARRYANARAEATMEVLAGVRSMGPKGAATVNVQGRSESAPEVKALRWAEQHLPTDWLASAGTVEAKAGRMSSYGEDGTITVAPLKDGARDGAGKYGASALHGLAHHLESTIPALRDAQWAYHWTRTSDDQGRRRGKNALGRLAHLFPGLGVDRDEVAREGSWPTPWLGREHDGNRYEVLALGLQDLFAGDEHLDDDLRKHLMGLLAWMRRNG